MKRTTITLCIAVFLFACNSAENKTEVAKNDEAKVSAANTEASTEPLSDSAMMKNRQAYMTPGKEHQMMASWDGDWSGEMTMWMKPGMAPSQSKVTTTNKMVLNGLYQQSTHKGSFNGMPFEGMGTLAFDNAKKIFKSTWIDNMGSGIMEGEGSWDPATNSLTIKGQMLNPGTGKDENFREVFKPVDNDHQIMEMYGPSPVDGKEFKNMEIRFTRIK